MRSVGGWACKEPEKLVSWGGVQLGLGGKGEGGGWRGMAIAFVTSSWYGGHLWVEA